MNKVLHIIREPGLTMVWSAYKSEFKSTGTMARTFSFRKFP